MSISCVKCNYAITEPLCAHCIINGVKLWFYERRIKQKIVRQINYQLTNLLRQVDFLDYAINPFEDVLEESTIKCICCNKEMHLMCFYCVNIQASQILPSLSKPFNLFTLSFKLFMSKCLETAHFSVRNTSSIQKSSTSHPLGGVLFF